MLPTPRRRTDASTLNAISGMIYPTFIRSTGTGAAFAAARIGALMGPAIAGYLIYLAYRMWTAPAVPRDVTGDARRDGFVRLFFAGLGVTLGNPKVVAFYLALLPNLIDLPRVGLFGYVELASVSVVILTLVFGAYVLAAVRARSLFRSARAMRLLNRAGGTMMAGAAVVVATK